MNILLYTPRVWDSTWGQEKNLVEELAKHHRMMLIDLIDYGLRYASKFQGQGYPVPEGVAIVKRQTRMKAGVLFGIYSEFRNLWDFLRVGWRNSDMVITYFTAGVILTVLLAKCTGKKVLLIYGDDYAELFRSKSSLVAWFTRYIGSPLVVRLSDHIVATAHKLKEDIERFNTRITVIPNGVQTEKFQAYHNREHEPAPARYNSEQFTVGFVGGFGNWVDFEMVLTVASALPDVKFKLIGSGDQFDDVSSLAEPLENLWVPGILPYEKVLEELATMDACLIPFKINRITDRVSPIKLFEYWAMRKAVVSTRFYEVQKIADKQVLFVDSADDLKKTILELKTHPELREKIARIGFEEVSRYDWTRLGCQYLRVIENL